MSVRSPWEERIARGPANDSRQGLHMLGENPRQDLREAALKMQDADPEIQQTQPSEERSSDGGNIGNLLTKVKSLLKKSFTPEEAQSFVSQLDLKEQVAACSTFAEFINFLKGFIDNYGESQLSYEDERVLTLAAFHYFIKNLTGLSSYAELIKAATSLNAEIAELEAYHDTTRHRFFKKNRPENFSIKLNALFLSIVKEFRVPFVDAAFGRLAAELGNYLKSGENNNQLLNSALEKMFELMSIKQRKKLFDRNIKGSGSREYDAKTPGVKLSFDELIDIISTALAPLLRDELNSEKTIKLDDLATEVRIRLYAQMPLVKKIGQRLGQSRFLIF